MADHQQQQQQHQSSSPSTTSSQSTLSAGGGGGVGINPGAAHGHGLGTAVPNSNSNSSVRSQTHQTMQNKQQHSLHLQSATSAAATTATSQSQQIQQPQQFTQHYNIPPGTINGPRTVVLNRHNGDFGFTLRHFIVYPPESCTEPSIAGRLAAVGALNFAQPMDTVFVKTVHRQTPAYFAGLQEGDRLLAVNGMAVAGTDYAHVVATIQQTPKTLTLEVVPKNFDILQTFFSETAHNPETNQRFQPQSQFSHLPIQLSRLSQQQQQLQQQQQVQHSQQSHNSIQPHKHLRNVTEKQESLYSTLQDIATGGVVVGATLDQQQTKHLKKQQTSQKGPPPQPPQRFIFNNTNINNNNNNNNINNDNLSLNSTDSNNTSTTISASTISTIPIATDRSTAMVPDQMQMISGDSAIITRLRKSFEQKEEFLRRPSQPLTQPIVAAVQQPPAPQQREFYSRPNRLQKATWPPPLVLTGVPLTNASGMQQHEMHGPPPMSPIIESNVKTSNNSLREHNQMTREQFFNSTIDSTAATKPVQLQQQQQQVSTKNDENSIIDEYHRQQQQKQSNTLRIVSERTKQFESGRPLSPDGIVVDRTSLYKSELSRLSNKQAVPNVALRKREFELKAENSSWRRSSDEKGRSSSIESESRRTSNRTRSLSAESSKERFTTTNEDIINYRRDKVNETPDYEYLKPTRENSYLTAVRNSSAFWLQGRSNDLLISQILENQSTQQNKENLSYDQMKDKKLMHRNQIIVEVHNQNSNSNDENNMMYGNYDGGCNNDGSDISEMILSSKKFGCADDDDDIEMKYYEKSRRYISSMNQSHQQSSQQQQPPNNQLYPQQMQQKPPHHQMPPPPIRPTTLNLTDSNNVVLRKKHHHHNLEEDDRPMRRVSYLRATANDNAFNIDSDIDSSPLSQPPDTPDTEDTNPSYPHHILKSAYRPWSRPRLTTDIQPLRRFFDDSPSAPIYLSSINENVPNCMDSFSPQHHQQQLPSTSSLSSTSQFLSSMLSATITTTTSMSAIIPPTSPTTTSSTPATTPTQISSSLYFHLPTSSVVATKNFFTQSHGTKLKSLSYFRDSPADSKYTIAREGELNVKVTIIDGKRSHDRSWRQVHAELRGNRLKLTLVRDGKNTNHSPEPSSIIDLTNFHVAEGNYTKRKHVFKITSSHPNPSSSQSNVQTNTLKGYERELLLQADSNNDMKLWMESLRNVCRSNQSLCSTNDFIINNLSSGSGSATTTNSNAINNNNSPQSAEPQRIAAVASVQSSGSIITSSNDEFSPILSTKSHRSKYSLGGSRSPSGQSPVTKSRKTPHSDSSDKEQSTGSPKSKTWKGIVARQLRKIQGSPGVNQTEILPLEGASIGVPLHLCPPSEEDEYVPLILTKCTSIVESKGLHVVGIYRIPGNTAAISCLTERVNRGLDEQTLKDPKWDDVNVVSSLLKCFIRSLPEPLLPNEMYNSFINADKLSGNERLIELKNLLDRLPHYYYETLKHLIRHLNCISKNCVVNLMEPRNLAIVFGPSVVRSANETLETAVKDMRHQCQIVEALVSHYTYFFENDPLPKLLEKDLHALADSSLETPSTSLLLDNVSKIEPFRESSRDSSTRFVANIVQAANRKIRRTAQRISVPSSATPDSQSLDSTTSAESKEQLKLRFFNDDTQKENQIASEPQPITPSRLSNDSNDCVFSDTDTGSMSLTTVTIALDNKLRSLRNSSIDSDKDLVLSESAANITTPTTVGAATIAHDTSNYKSQLLLQRPLTLGENIPFADESPERPLRAKPVRHTYNSSSGGGSTANNSNLNLNNFSTKLDAAVEQLQQTVLQNALQTTKTMGIENSSASDVVDNKDINSTSSSASTSSDDTDTSTTSNPREKISSAIRLDTDVLREVNRILTNLERKANNLERKFSLNRSLSLNYKNHKNNECCCLLNNMQNYHGGSKINNLNYNMNNNNNNTNNNNNANNNSNNNNNNINNSRSRLLLTKNEKTDKNINKRRQIQDINNSTSSSCSSNTSSNNSCNNIIANNNNNNNNNNANNKLATSSSYHHRRNIGINNRSIRRRHTVGGTHDYFNTNKSLTNHHNNINYCQNYLNTNYNNDKLTKEDVVVNDGVKNDN